MSINKLKIKVTKVVFLIVLFIISLFAVNSIVAKLGRGLSRVNKVKCKTL